MSVVAFTFGSLGDIVTLLQIANVLRKELCDLPGISAEYHDLILELDSVVFTVSSVLSTLSIQGPSRFEQSVENAIYHAVGASLRLLTEMNQRIFTWRHRNSASAATMVVSVWRRVGWTLFSKRELLDYRGRLSSQVLAMNTLLTLAQRTCLGHVNSQVAQFREESREQFALIREIYRCVKNPPRRMGYTWEGEPDSDSMPVIFTDILGRTTPLPWELLSTRQREHEFLLFYFQNRPGRDFVKYGSYRITVGSKPLRRHQRLTREERFSKEYLTIQDYGPGSTVHMYWYIHMSDNRYSWASPGSYESLFADLILVTLAPLRASNYPDTSVDILMRKSRDFRYLGKGISRGGWWPEMMQSSAPSNS